jgi:CBS domain-containing protein
VYKRDVAIHVPGNRTPSLFLDRVRDFVKRAPVTCEPGLPIVDVARRMSDERVGSVIVVDANLAPLGIVTDRDLRRKVVADARDPRTTTAADVMSRPLVSVRPAAFGFEALLEMTRREIHHLVVLEDERLAGVVSTHDFLMLQTTHPVMLAREIARAPNLAALRELAGRITAMTRRLVEEGGTPYDVGRIVAELNDRAVIRVLALARAALEDEGAGRPPLPYCWIALGSEARREQTLRTDQDNGLIYANAEPDIHDSAAAWFARFAERAVSGLIEIGVPPCPGGWMASNPKWCQSLAAWAGYFRSWMTEPEPEPVLAAQIVFDLRPLAGAMELAASLRALIAREAPKHRLFLGLLARDVVTRRAPLTLFGNVAVARSGPHRGTVDLKGGGTIQLVGAARIHTLELGLEETNTVDRFRAASANGLYRDDEAREITDAFQHLTRLRLLHQLACLARGESADNHVRASALSRADAILLLDALKTVQRVQAGVRERFRTDLVR